MPPEETTAKKPVYDPRKVSELLKVAGAYQSHPLGEYINELAAQLTLADEQIGQAHAAMAAANSARNKAEADLDNAQATIHRMRSGATGMSELVDALKAITLNPKGAKAVATAALAKVNGKDAP